MAEEHNFKIKTIEDIKPGVTPATGISADPFSLPLYQYDEKGNIIGSRDFGGSGISKAQRGYVSDPEKARIGDYYYDDNGNLNVVPNSPTDVFNKWKITNDSSLYAKPQALSAMGIEDILGPLMTPAAIGGMAATGSAKAAAGAMGLSANALMSGQVAEAAGIAAANAGAVGALGTAAMVASPLLAINLVVSANQQMAKEKAYRQALKDWQKSQERAIWKVAGNLVVDDDGKITFTPDASKAISMNPAFSGTEIQKAFNKETKVYFGDDGRLKIEVNPIFAATDNYKEIVEAIKKGYAGLTKDSEGVNDALEEIKSYIDGENNQFKFREQSIFAYKNKIPGASDTAIEDAYKNEVGAYMSEQDTANWDVKVYRGGEIKSETAQKVLEDFYNKDMGKRSDYMLDLYMKMEDPNISDDDKVYILSEAAPEFT